MGGSMATSFSFIFFCYLVFPFLLSSDLAYAYEERGIAGSINLNYTHIVRTSSLLPSNVCRHSTRGHTNGRHLKVVNRHGPCSHLDQQKIQVPNLTQILIQDRLRVNWIHSRLAVNLGHESFQTSATTLPAKSGRPIGTGNYVVIVGLGTPKEDLTLVFDTGSDLSWTQCKPCVGHCYDQQEPIFDPSSSSSYSNVSCFSAQCSQNIKIGCTSSTCVYGVRYGDQSETQGFLAKERLTLTSSDALDGFLFGCGQYNDGLFGRTAGLLGLGRAPESIVSQAAQKYGRFFSYCLPTLSGSTGFLSFGSSGGNSNSLKFTNLGQNADHPSFYYIDIVDISVGGQNLNLPPSLFSSQGSIIDSGTVITRLPKTAYAALRSAFQQQMSNYPTTSPPPQLFDTCYDLSGYSTVSIPKITFLFGNNVNMDIVAEGILRVVSATQFCLAFAGNSDDNQIAIFGNYQQQKYEVVYDVAGGRLGFGAGACD
ncbi:Xylanase inhibitor, C-terminal [Dillenia turbinata]|uniref:Xylanase inhibitor, C-terminal n=1 Tax=Dillenia turbinata TaxID=194707 RepID=A0AAN8V3C9_9MAGN